MGYYKYKGKSPPRYNNYSRPQQEREFNIHTTFTNGKHKGKTVKYVVKNDPNYLRGIQGWSNCRVHGELLDYLRDNGILPQRIK